MPTNSITNFPSSSPGLAYSQGSMTNDSSTYVDCQATIVGWFQISDRLNPSTNNYIPETNRDGTPISGPGWVAYEKPGAMPGDVVIIYRVMTITSTMTAGSGGANFSNVLWDLLDPCGLSYFTTQYSFKSCISKSDLVSLLPHAGGPLTPNNPDNPYGDQDILWRNVTTQYGLPGPGNSSNPSFIRWVLPGFGIRILFWTDSCCVFDQVIPPINVPDIPTIAPVPVPTPSPGGPGSGPGIGGGIPGGGGFGGPAGPSGGAGAPGGGGFGGPAGGSTGGKRRRPGGVVVPLDPQPPIRKPGTGGTTPGNNNVPGANEGDPTPSPDLPEVNTPTVLVSSGPSTRFRRPGIAPIRRNYQDTDQVSYYSSNGAMYVKRTNPNDLGIYARAVRVGPRALYIRNGGMDHAKLYTNTMRTAWLPSLTQEELASYGISLSIAGDAAATITKPITSSPAGNESNVSSQETLIMGGIQPNQNSATALPIRSRGDAPLRTPDQTRGGYKSERELTYTDLGASLHQSIPRDIGQITSYRSGQSNPRAGKFTQLTTKGGDQRAVEDRVGIQRRSPNIINGSVVAARLGSEMALVKRNQLSIKTLNKTTEPIRLENIKDKNNKYSVTPIRLSSGNGFTFLVLIEGNVDSNREEVQLVTNAYVRQENGEASYLSVGGTGFITFGITNPPQPGQYVIANPVCMPGQGSVPDIIAGGQQWSFMQLVFTLLDINSTLIAQSVVSFLPAPAGATDVEAPNRLPRGLMSDLGLADTSVPHYDGTYVYNGANQANWFMSEPSIVVEKIGTSSTTATVVLKATVDALSATPPFRPLLEIYDNALLLSSSNALTAFIGGPCLALPGWYNPIGNVARASGGIHTACPGSNGLGGAGGTSAYVTDSLSQVISGPYNPAMYAGTHQCFLCFKGNDASLISTSSAYRIRVYNNGPASSDYGYALYFANLKIKQAVGNLTIDAAGNLAGSIKTYHCCHILKIKNINTGEEIERFSAWEDGTIYIGTGPAGASSGGNNIFFSSNTDSLAAQPGDTIVVYRPGFNNNYASERVVLEVTL